MRPPFPPNPLSPVSPAGGERGNTTGPAHRASFSPPHLRGRGVLLLAFLALAACSSGEAAPAPRYQKAFYKDKVVELPTAEGREPGQLATVPGETVVGRTSPNGEPFEVALRTGGDPTHLTRRFGSRAMDLGARVRTPDLGQYPCSSCHVDGGVLPGVDRIADAHQNIQPVHPRETGATCTGCHASENVATLALGNGERASLDHAYRLCAQCHSTQVEDWAAGAHGKRLDGWQGRRVVMGCADCHDPHHPALEQRIPFSPPHIRQSGGRER
jgi:hypothetical protein